VRVILHDSFHLAVCFRITFKTFKTLLSIA